MARYTITLESGTSFSCSEDTYILDAADEQMNQGYGLLCVSYPLSDCTIKPNAEEELI